MLKTDMWIRFDPELVRHNCHDCSAATCRCVCVTGGARQLVACMSGVSHAVCIAVHVRLRCDCTAHAVVRVIEQHTNPSVVIAVPSGGELDHCWWEWTDQPIATHRRGWLAFSSNTDVSWRHN